MLNKLQAIIKNMIIMVYCLARPSVGVRVLRSGQASLIGGLKTPREGPLSFLALLHLLEGKVSVRAGGHSGEGSDVAEEHWPGPSGRTGAHGTHDGFGSQLLLLETREQARMTQCSEG